MKDYYSILEISRTASQEDIKRAYRRLALKYHPDKSSYSDAGKLFSLINEAYKVLGKAESRALYDLQQSAPTNRTAYTTQPPYSQSRSYTRQRPNPHAYAAYQQSRTTSKVDITPYIRHFKSISIAAFVFCTIISFDYFLPSFKTPDYVLAKKFNPVKQTYRITLEEGVFEVAGTGAHGVQIGQMVELNHTPLFHKLVKISFLVNGRQFDYAFQASIYHNFSFALIILIVTSYLGAFQLKNPEMVMNFAIVNGILFILVFVFLVIS